MKPCPPQDLALSPESAKKMLVPSITIVESSPITESHPQMCYPLKSSDKSKFRTSALQNLKSIGPSLQSFVIATAKGLKANFPSGTKSDKSDSVKEKKSKTSPPLQRQSSSDSLSLSSIRNVLQKSPKLPRQSSLSEIKERPNASKSFKSLSDESSDVSFESAKAITPALKNKEKREGRIEEKVEFRSRTLPDALEKVPPDHRDSNEMPTLETSSPESTKLMTSSYPTVTNTEFPITRMTPPITRQTKVSFAIPEDSDSSSSGMSSLTSPWSSPQVQRPTLSRQRPIETEITGAEQTPIETEITGAEQTPIETKITGADQTPIETEITGADQTPIETEITGADQETENQDQIAGRISSTSKDSPGMPVEGSMDGQQPNLDVSSAGERDGEKVVGKASNGEKSKGDVISIEHHSEVTEQADEFLDQPKPSASSLMESDQTVQQGNMLSDNQHDAGLRTSHESSRLFAISVPTTQEGDLLRPSVSSLTGELDEDTSKHQLRPPDHPPKLSSSSSEGDIVNNLLSKEGIDVSEPAQKESVKKASSTDCINSESTAGKSVSTSQREPFKSSISSSALLLSSLSPVLPRSHNYYSYSLSSLNTNSILAGNVPLRPGRSAGMPSIRVPYTPLQSMSQSVPNLRDSRKRQTSAPPSFRQSLPETSFIEEELGNSDTNVMIASVEGLPKTDTDSEAEVKKTSLQTGVKSKEGPSKISTNPTVSRTKSGPKVQSSKAARDSQRPPKGPSGIVMGKAAILPNRGGPRSTAGTRKPGASQEAKKETPSSSEETCRKKKTSPSRKSPVVMATAESHNYSCATCGRRRSAASRLLEEAQHSHEKEKTDSEKQGSERRLSGSARVSRNLSGERKSSEATKSKPPKLNKDRTPRFV